MLKVGIHENLFLSKTVKNDKGTLVIGYKEAGEASGNLLDSFNEASDDTATETNEQDFLIYGPQATAKGGELDTATNNQKKVKEIKDQLTHILLNFMTKDKLKWNLLVGTGIDTENVNEKMVEQGVLDKMYANMVDQFISMMNDYVNQSSLLFRVIFVRQSKAKHYPVLRKRWLSSNPFMESMSIPKSASKLKFTDWEVKEGFDSAEPARAADTVNSDEARSAAGIFNS